MSHYSLLMTTSQNRSNLTLHSPSLHPLPIFLLLTCSEPMLL